jgi:hypothetical protein
MSAENPVSRDRLLDLLADDATLGLSGQERAELDALVREFPGSMDGSMERAAAAADLAMGASARAYEPMPAHLRSKILADGERIASGYAASNAGPVQGTASRTGPIRIATAGRPTGASTGGSVRSRRPDRMAFAGWLAAAAAVVIAAMGWMRPSGGTGTGPISPRPTPPLAANPVVEREQLMATVTDEIVVPLGAWDNPEQPGVTGDVVWSESAQKGYLRLAGLKPNDPTVEQYQLWIVDSRGMGQRISGALFDAKPDPATGEVVVEIEPQIATQGAAAFALTIEKPGGVWVSDMTRRVVIGAKG